MIDQEIEEGDWQAAAEEEARLLFAREREESARDTVARRALEELLRPSSRRTPLRQQPIVRRSSAPAKYPPHEWQYWGSPSMKDRCKVCGRVPTSSIHF